MTIMNILVIVRAQPEHLTLLELAAPGARVVRQSVKTLTAQQVEEADVIVGNLPPEFLAHMKKTKLLQLNTAGVAPHYIQAAREMPHLVLCCASGAYGPAISEHMLGMLLCLMKQLHRYRDDQPRALWREHTHVRSLRGARVLVVGMGDIGTHFAALLVPFGARVTGVKRRPAQAPPGVETMAVMSQMDSLLPQADVVALCLPETPQTIGLMDSARFALMKPGSFLINVGRGSAVDQEALGAALHSGHLAGAALDVTTPEPLPKEHPLWQQPNALITPHVSGHYTLGMTLDNVYDIARTNILALRGGGAFTARVDTNSGYRE